MIASASLPVPADLAMRVTEASYARLLGYPDGEIAGDRSSELARASREWFLHRARPWACAATLGPVAIEGATVAIASGPRLSSAVLAERLRAIDADRLVVALVSAGIEVDRESAAMWDADRPDEAYFLDRFGAAAAIHLGAWAASHLRAEVAGAGWALAPGYSPGYDGWSLADQQPLGAALVAALPDPGVAPRLKVLQSGMLEPKSSLLAAFGLGTGTAAAERLWARHRCSWCSLDGCTLRGVVSPTVEAGT